MSQEQTRAISVPAAGGPPQAPQATRRDALQRMVDFVTPRIRELKTVSPERFAQIVLVEGSRNPELAECSTASLAASLMLAAELGLEPSGPRGHAYLIPRNVKIKGRRGEPERWEKQCSLLIGYKGLAELARRSGQIVRINAGVVYLPEIAAGLFSATLEPPSIRHDWSPMVERRDDEIAAAYATAEMRDGSRAQVILTRGDIDARRERGKERSFSPWQSDYAAMARKTALRALLAGGLVPLGEPAQRALELDADAPEPVDHRPRTTVQIRAQAEPAAGAWLAELIAARDAYLADHLGVLPDWWPHGEIRDEATARLCIERLAAEARQEQQDSDETDSPAEAGEEE